MCTYGKNEILFSYMAENSTCQKMYIWSSVAEVVSWLYFPIPILTKKEVHPFSLSTEHS